MKKKLNEEIEKSQREMMIVGAVLTIISLVGLYIWAYGIQIVHPAIYIMGIIMGNGFFCTACVSMLDKRN